MTTKYQYGKMTWPEIKEAAAQKRVALLPTGCIEDHGPHLPLDVDVLLPTTICERAAALVPDQCVVVPAVAHGYDPHHLDFPGVIHVDGHVFVRYLVDICKSLIHHGFTRIIMLNGHGSNTAFTEVAARLAVIETEGVRGWSMRSTTGASPRCAVWWQNCATRLTAACPTAASWKQASTSPSIRKTSTWT